MDSFYGVPRQPPKPPTINSIQRQPVVPEVSMIDNSFFPPIHLPNIEDSISKKHIRFKNRDFIPNKENIPQPVKTTPNLNGKTFKQIYMANVPDRHLDLSIFESPATKTTDIQNYDSIKPITPPNYNKHKPDETQRKFTKECIYPRKATPQRAEISVQTEPLPQQCTDITPANDEPTIRDLFKIIQQQNEQIMLLQRQINNLKTNKQSEFEPIESQNRDLNGNSPTKKLFSFDVKATSFEFSFRPPQTRFRNKEFLEPKIQEIVEAETTTDNNSLHLDESLEIRNSYVSNVPSIAIDMEDYHSSEDEEQPQIGLTFYKDLMNQVNKALRKAKKKSEYQASEDISGQTMKAVKQATLQHLKKIGVNLSPIQESSEVIKDNESLASQQSDVSCAVQQLLMKYLPSEELANVHKTQPVIVKNKLKPPAEFSFATLQYMKKYNLIDNKFNDVEKKPEISPKILDVTALKLQPKLL